jgi:hypothetical protein
LKYFRPLPTFDVLFKFLAFFYKGTIVYPKDRLDDNFFRVAFKRSREALFALINSFYNRYGENITIWLPKLYCWEIAAMINNDNVIIKFYDVDNSLNPNWNKLESVDTGNSLNIFCLVSFFGKISDVTNARSFAQKRSMILLFDETHSAKPSVFPDQQNEYMIWSPYKHFPTPDGAFLYVSKKFDISCLINYLDQIPISSKFSNLKSDFVWLLKSYIVRFFKHRMFLVSTLNTNETIRMVSIEKIKEIKLGISRFDFQQIQTGIQMCEPRLSDIYSDWNKIVLLLNNFVECEKFPSVQTGSHLFGVKFKSVEDAKTTFDILRKLKFPVIRWPEQEFAQLFKEELLTTVNMNVINSSLYLVTSDIYSKRKVLMDDVEFVKLEKKLYAVFKARRN